MPKTVLSIVHKLKDNDIEILCIVIAGIIGSLAFYVSFGDDRQGWQELIDWGFGMWVVLAFVYFIIGSICSFLLAPFIVLFYQAVLFVCGVIAQGYSATASYFTRALKSNILLGTELSYRSITLSGKHITRKMAGDVGAAFAHFRRVTLTKSNSRSANHRHRPQNSAP